MSANNYVLIKKVPIEERPPVGVVGINYIIEHRDAEGGTHGVIGKTYSLEEAIKFANQFMQENIVEYGLQVAI